MKSSMNVVMSLENVMTLMEGNPKFSSTLDSLQTSKHNLDIVKRYETEFTNSGIEGLKRVKNLLNKNNLDSSFLIFEEKDLDFELTKKYNLARELDKKKNDLDSKISLIKQDRTISEIEKEGRIKKVDAEKLEIIKKSMRVSFLISDLKTRLSMFKNASFDGSFLTKMFNENKSLIESQLEHLDEDTRIDVEAEIFKVGRYVESLKSKQELEVKLEEEIKSQITGVGIAIEEPKVEEAKADTIKVETPKVDAPKVEEPKVEEPKVEESKVEEPKVEEVKADEIEPDTLKVEEPKAEEIKTEEPKIYEPKFTKTKTEEPAESKLDAMFNKFLADGSKVKKDITYKVTKIRKGFLDGYVKSMLVGSALGVVAMYSLTLTPVLVGAGVGFGYNLLRNKMIKNMNIKLESDALDNNEEITEVSGLLDGFRKLKKAYKEKKVENVEKVQDVKENEYEKFSNREAVLEANPQFQEIETPVEQVKNNDLISPEMNFEDLIESLEGSDNLDDEVAAKMGGR